MILPVPCPGISAEESRGIESLRTLPNWARTSMIESARPGPPWVSSIESPLRSSEPSTRIVAPLKRLPLPFSASSASEDTPPSSWALTKNSTSESRIQPSDAERDPLDHPAR